ncbi:alpha-2-macroglobulin-like protein 1 [Phyllobates terribilis]|uniref:alpha-2-macroglobulin-like protein 1 n=1 Tax=Phyllobates terribilis TaxID=111132 RepID=UPI003CCAA353
MWHQLLLLTYGLIPLTIGKSSSIGYLLLIPAEIHFPSNETLCVDIRGAPEALRVTATLQHGVEDSILLQEMMTESQLFKCVQFKTPPPEGGKEVVTVFMSLVGPTTQMSDSKKVLVRAVGHATLIQTDKPLYKRGQTVNFRILIFNRDFLAVEDICPMVEIQDPNKNRIGQWLNLKPQNGIIDLFFSLDFEAPLGAYTIIAPHAREDFHVAEYVIPTFEVTVDLPSVVTLLEKTFPVKTCGRYTFGKPVQGEITATICREAICYYWMRSSCPKDICTEYKGQTEKNGCIEVEVSTESYNLRSYNYQLTFDAKATLVENGTGVEMTGTGSCRISAKIATVILDDKELLDSYYKMGLRYKTKMILESADGSTMKSQILYLTEKYGKTIKEHEYETNEHGEAYITLNTRAWNGNPVYLTATYKKEKVERTYGELNPYYVDAYRNLQPFTTITNSFLKVQPLDSPLTCGKVHEIEIDYIIRSSEMLSEEDSLEFHYLVVAKGSLVLNGKMNVKMEKTSVMMGTVILPLSVTVEMSPLAKIFAYAILSNGRIAADTEKFSVVKCFNNKVTLDFSKKEALPGSDVTLRVSADPGSLCSVRAVDKGVLLLRPEADISDDTVYNFVKRRNQFGYPYRVHEEDPICWKPRVSFLYSKRRKRSYNWPAPSSPDVFTLIKHLGLKVITNTQVKKPPECLEFPPGSALNVYGSPIIDVPDFPSSVDVDDYDDSNSRVTLTIAELTNKIRTMFPETWIFQLLTMGSTGQAEISMQLPDSITEWKTTAFCMGDVGLGIAPTTSIQSFQSFFIDLTHPYSVIKGEIFSLSATVFNYLASPMMVKFHIEESEDLQMYDCPKCSIPQCLPPLQTVVFAWEAKALHIGFAEIQLRTEAISTQELCNGQQPIVPDTGSSDSLVKTVLIKAEGVPIEIFHNSILCGGGNLSSETISITLPPEVVPDSAVAVFSVAGDLMGSALQSIEQLLQLPCGCGEQNMVRFVPNIYILDYMASANLLSEETKKAGIGYILHGYQRELNYHRADGSFSTFGEKDEEGNTWLSAFVMKSFHASSRWIPFVDKKYFQEIIAWLKENQLPSGCFQNRGKLFRASIKGGVNDEVSLTAYVTVALLEIMQHLENEMVQTALQYLRDSVSKVDSLYTKALLAYAFTLSRDYELLDTLLDELHDEATNAGGDTYWPTSPSNPTKDPLWSQPNSNEVELASYVLLAHLSKDNPTKTDIDKASSIASWIGKQQNPYGGFVSTQDTVVGLQGLALFSKLTYCKHEGLEVIFGLDGENTMHSFYVDESSRFLLQKKQFGKLPGDYTVQVKGEGCAFLKVTLKYNIYPNQADSFFHIQVNLTLGDSMNKSKLMLNYSISVRYVGQRSKTNMVLIETELPSGFRANLDSLEMLEKNKLVKKTETKDKKIILYIEELSKTTEEFMFSTEQQIEVKDLKPCSVKVYDYYETGEESYAIYNLPSS